MPARHPEIFGGGAARRVLPLLLLLLLLAACALPQADAPPGAVHPSMTETAPTQAPPRPSPLPPPSPTPPPLPSPTTEQPAEGVSALQNARVDLPETGAVRLREGRFSEGEVRLTLQEVAVGGEMAAAVVSVNLGGSGNFAYLLHLENEGGQWKQRGAAYFIEDRPILHALTLEEGRIVLEVTLHWLDEPFCCPTKRARLVFEPVEGGLRLQRLSTFTAGGTEYALTLRSAEIVGEEGASVAVSGRVSVTPFEGMLTYRCLGEDGLTVLAEGGLMVTPDNPQVPGSPGAFEAVLPLPPLPPGAGFQLQIVDLSLRDDSPVAMDAVWFEGGE